jgi:hypothetical protein
MPQTGSIASAAGAVPRPARPADRADVADAVTDAVTGALVASAPAARSWTSSARMATAISACVVLPRSSPAGTWTLSSCSVGTPRSAR